MTERIEVDCRTSAGGWTCSVSVGSGADVTTYDVTVSAAELQMFAGGAADPRQLVKASFEFLLERESRSSILRRFEIGVIARYFPDYPAEIRRRLNTA